MGGARRRGRGLARRVVRWKCWPALALALPAVAFAQAGGGYGDYVAWESWARVVPGERAALASSWDRTGGLYDANQYEAPPGLITGDLDVVAATLHGPGIIERFWMPHFTATQPFAIRMYFDGETVPRIATDSGQLLGGTFGYFASPFVSTFAGGQVSYEPIVFRDSLRIETENRSGRWHWYHYSVRRLVPGTDVTSYTGSLDASAQSARSAAAAMFQNLGQHPAGESNTSTWHATAATSVPPNGHVTIADLVGPGLIRRLCVRMDGAGDADLDNLRLRIFYDGDVQPAVDSPVGWFFGAGHGRVPYKSLPMGTDSPDGFYCYWPIPFHEAVRVELANSRAIPVDVDDALVEYEVQAVANDCGYLHAAAKTQFSTGGNWWSVLATASGTGHYVGNLLFVEQSTNSHLFLEGDDLVVVDAADSLHGTGLEDAYNGGFYYNWVDPPMAEPEGPSPSSAIRPLSGILRVAKSASPPFACADQYRWMIADRVPFSHSLEVSVENQYAVVGSRWTSVVFWYQLPEIVSGARAPGAAPRPLGLQLSPSEPHPVREAAVLRFSLPAEEVVTLDLLDVSGRKVRTLLEGRCAAGPHETRFRRGSLPSGVYFLRLRAAGQIETRKLVLVR